MAANEAGGGRRADSRRPGLRRRRCGAPFPRVRVRAPRAGRASRARGFSLRGAAEPRCPLHEQSESAPQNPLSLQGFPEPPPSLRPSLPQPPRPVIGASAVTSAHFFCLSGLLQLSVGGGCPTLRSLEEKKREREQEGGEKAREK